MHRDANEIIWFMDDEETCRRDRWFTTDVKTGEIKVHPAPFDQDFYLVLNVVSSASGLYKLDVHTCF